jgi:hypothetical protein
MLSSKHFILRLSIVGVIALVYFVMYPDDLAVLIRPVENLLAASQSISPWLYGVIGVSMICWTVTKVWGVRAAPGERV